ncbi:MAG: hypothetical protein WBV61_12395 [Rhodanobacteraceae bacterium]
MEGGRDGRDTDAAIAALPHLLEKPDGATLAELRLSPVWDALRQDPRFEALLEKPPSTAGDARLEPRLRAK